MFYFWQRIHFLSREKIGLKILELLWAFFSSHSCELETDKGLTGIYKDFYVYIKTLPFIFS